MQQAGREQEARRVLDYQVAGVIRQGLQCLCSQVGIPRLCSCQLHSGFGRPGRIRWFPYRRSTWCLEICRCRSEECSFL